MPVSRPAIFTAQVADWDNLDRPREPAPSVAEALSLVESDGNRLDAAVLDVNLGNERVYPVAASRFAEFRSS